MSKISPLATGQLTEVDGLSVELHRPHNEAAFVMILWPPRPTEIPADPKVIAAVTATIVKILAEAQTRLRMTGRRPKLDL
jgi:hypothetical protein